MCKMGKGCYEEKNGYCIGDIQGYPCGEKPKEKMTINYKSVAETYYKGEKAYYDKVAELTD